jgi:hypothetical protein
VVVSVRVHFTGSSPVNPGNASGTVLAAVLDHLQEVAMVEAGPQRFELRRAYGSVECVGGSGQDPAVLGGTAGPVEKTA